MIIRENGENRNCNAIERTDRALSCYERKIGEINVRLTNERFISNTLVNYNNVGATQI